MRIRPSIDWTPRLLTKNKQNGLIFFQFVNLKRSTLIMILSKMIDNPLLSFLNNGWRYTLSSSLNTPSRSICTKRERERKCLIQFYQTCVSVHLDNAFIPLNCTGDFFFLVFQLRIVLVDKNLWIKMINKDRCSLFSFVSNIIYHPRFDVLIMCIWEIKVISANTLDVKCKHRDNLHFSQYSPVYIKLHIHLYFTTKFWHVPCGPHRLLL